MPLLLSGWLSWFSLFAIKGKMSLSPVQKNLCQGRPYDTGGNKPSFLANNSDFWDFLSFISSAFFSYLQLKYEFFFLAPPPSISPFSVTIHISCMVFISLVLYGLVFIMCVYVFLKGYILVIFIIYRELSYLNMIKNFAPEVLPSVLKFQ